MINKLYKKSFLFFLILALVNNFSFNMEGKCLFLFKGCKQPKNCNKIYLNRDCGRKEFDILNPHYNTYYKFIINNKESLLKFFENSGLSQFNYSFESIIKFIERNKENKFILNFINEFIEILNIKSKYKIFNYENKENNEIRINALEGICPGTDSEVGMDYKNQYGENRQFFTYYNELKCFKHTDLIEDLERFKKDIINKNNFIK